MSTKREAAAKARPPGKTLRTSILVMVGASVLLIFCMILAASPEQYSLSVGDIAPKTITATKDVTDEVTTEQRRERAAEAVQPSYKEDETAKAQVLSQFGQIFEEYKEIRAYGEEIRNAAIVEESEAYSTGQLSVSFSREQLDHADALTTRMELSDWQLTILMRQSASELTNVYTHTSAALSKAMDGTIREGQLESAISSIQSQVLPYVSSDLCLNIAMPAVRACLVPNMVVDLDATEANREAARNDVDPTVYKSGQNIVVAGERITSAQLAVLESLGLLEGNRSDVQMMVGVCVLGVLCMLAVLFHVLQFDKPRMTQGRNAVMLSVIFLLAGGISLLMTQINPYLTAVSMVTLLVATLLSPSMALICNPMALIVIGVLTNTPDTTFIQQMLCMLVTGIFSAPVGIYMSQRKMGRPSLLLAGFSMAVTSFLGMIAIGLLTNNEIKTILQNALWSAGGCLLSAVFSLGAQPLLESIFNLVTPYKLLDLANPNQPLLRKLLTETPGTYHHSILVANMSESAAEAVGADPLLTRVGAYYHDIGKTNRPQFFKENQLHENPHDFTDPRVSAAIIAAHVTDGEEMARQARLPQEVIDFISQHHGDSLIGFFLHKMQTMEGGQRANPEDFMYKGPKPQTVETSIVSMADAVEAGIRAGGEQEAEVIERRIQEIIKGKIDSGQLSESPLRFADIQKIALAFAQVLNGIYHKRIEYPKLANLPPQLAAPASLPAEEKASAPGND